MVYNSINDGPHGLQMGIDQTRAQTIKTRMASMMIMKPPTVMLIMIQHNILRTNPIILIHMIIIETRSR